MSVLPARLLAYLRSFSPARQPWITRQSYRHELVTALTYPVAVSLIEGGVIGVLATKAFRANAALFAVITAAPMFANLTSIVWAWLARGRRKVQFINALQVLSLVCVGLIACLPLPQAQGDQPSQTGAALLAGLIVLLRCLLAGNVTIRSTIWRNNYPRAVRATVTGRITVLQSLIVGCAPLAAGPLFDFNPQAFRIAYPLGALIALVGTAAFAKVRLRRERELLAYERRPASRPVRHGSPAPIYEFDADAPLDNFWSVLRKDHFFRRYMIAQFVTGGANMMGEIALIRIIAHWTGGLKAEYLIAIALTTVIPMLLATATMPYWSRYMDRVHIAHVRARQSWLWVLDQIVNWVGAASGSLWILGCGRVVQGACRGAGMLAWNLGHNDFASRRLVAVYMGIHVTLTGVRGAIFPFLAIWLLEGWGGDPLAWAGLHLPAFAGIGPHVFAVTTALMIVGNISFNTLSRRIAALERDGRMPAR